MIMPTVFKVISSDEQAQALDLWHSVFGVPKDFFMRYYADDPWYREGDSFGAWVDGALVSAIHLCRRPLAWEDASLLCGGIANVATLPEYRKRGLSRRLLSQAIARMDEGGFDFSALGTGIPDFYAVHGWESIPLPHFEMTMSDTVSPSDRELLPAVPTKELGSLYVDVPRALQLERPDRYFDGWVGWSWASECAQALTLPGGYVILEFPEDEAQLASVKEWRACDAVTEVQLLRGAAALARAHGRTRVVFAALPQHASLADLEPLGTLERTHASGQMIRSVSLSESDYAQVKASYLSGQAAWWPADGF
jgi:predicted acetyltransferase